MLNYVQPVSEQCAGVMDIVNSRGTHNSKVLTIGNVRDSIVGVDAEVPLLDGSRRPYVYFDNAASTPVLRPVFDKVNELMTWYSSVHRGSGFKSQLASHAYEEAHRIVAEFVGADLATHTVIFGKNSTEALNKLAKRLPLASDDVVLSTLMEHHSNDLPWRRVAQTEHVDVDDSGALSEAHLDYLLNQHKGHVRLIAVTGASNVTGYVNDVHRLAVRAHSAGAEILVDCAQLAPHRAICVGSLDDPRHLDYVVLSAHKMYAPYGTGALVGRRDTFLRGDPDMVGGGTVDLVSLDEVKWADLPDKEEAGSPNVVGAVALAKAMLCLKEITMEDIAEHERALTAYLLTKLASIERVSVFGPIDPMRAGERVGVVSFAVAGMSHYLVAAILGAEAGVGVRHGCFCAHPYLLKLLRVSASDVRQYHDEVRRGSRANLPGLVRVSFGCYNNEAEIDWLIESLERIIGGAYRDRYVQDPVSGNFRPLDFSPDLGRYFTLQ